MKRQLRRKIAGTNVRQFTVYLPEEFDQWLRDEAHRCGRTLSKQTEIVLRAGREVIERTKQVA